MELRSRTARAIVLPEHGGRLHQLYVTAGGAEHALLLSPGDPAEYSAQPHRGGSFVMAPWPNRVAGGRFRFNGREWAVPITSGANAIHGLVAGAPWRVVARTARVVELSCGLGESWPWPGSVWQRIELTDSALRLKLEFRSEREPFPAGCGWHPWFRRDVRPGAEPRVLIDAGEMYEARAMIPTGALLPVAGESDLRAGPELGDRRLDTCYPYGPSGPHPQGALWVRWGDIELTIASSANVRHAVVYTPARAFCVEPQTCAIDAFNLDARGLAAGVTVVAPGRPLVASTTWRWRLHP